jgi:hypothetical protein
MIITLLKTGKSIGKRDSFANAFLKGRISHAQKQRELSSRLFTMENRNIVASLLLLKVESKL